MTNQTKQLRITDYAATCSGSLPNTKQQTPNNHLYFITFATASFPELTCSLV